MNVSSQYYFLNEEFLLEYIYNSDIVNTSDKGFNILDNNNINEKQLFSENSWFPENVNILDKSFTNTDKISPKYIYLDQDLVTTYNDYDTNLNLTALSFLNNYDITYDTVRIYFRSGYNLEDIEGIYLNIKIRLNDSTFTNLANLSFLKYDQYKEFLPNTLIMGEGTFNSYIDLKIPSLESLKLENINFPSDTDKLWNKISDGKGIHTDSNIIIDFGLIDRNYKETININPTLDQEYTFFELIQEASFSVNSIDGYANIHAHIEEVDDYYEFQAKYNGIAISDYITKLNQEINSEWIILHDIILFEQILTNNIQTSIYSFVQESDYDDPLLFRPVLKHSDTSISYTIQYTIRIFNRVTNEQITKTSQVISKNVKKYGRKLSKINLGYIPTIDKIYNEIKNKPTSNFIPKLQERIFNREKFAINYFENTNVSLNINSNEKIIEFNDKSIFNQYEALIILNDLDNYLKFNVYEQLDDSYKDKNLIGLGTIYITFIDNNNKEVKIKQVFDDQFDLSNGELLFKIPKNKSQKIITYKNSNFYLIVKTDNSESILYTGNWIYSKEKSKQNVIKQSLVKDKEILELKKEILDFQDNIKELNLTIKQKDKTINTIKETQLNKSINPTSKFNKIYSKVNDEFFDRSANLKKGIKLKNYKINKSTL